MKMVIFDLGGVLFDWNPRHLFKKIFKSEDQMEHFLAHVCNQEWNIQQDKGRPFAEGVAELVAKYPQHKKEIEAYHHRWIEMVAGPITPMVELLEDLKRMGHRLSALSNWSAETFVPVRAQYGFLKHFELILVSGEEKLAKPDPAFYRLLLERVGLSAAECVFIDDVHENVQAAEKVGIKAIHFREVSEVRRKLGELGFKTRA